MSTFVRPSVPWLQLAAKDGRAALTTDCARTDRSRRDHSATVLSTTYEAAHVSPARPKTRTNTQDVIRDIKSRSSCIQHISYQTLFCWSRSTGSIITEC